MVDDVASMIFGRDGGPSTTSNAEVVSSVPRRSLVPLGIQVVRPQIPRSGRRGDLIVGRGFSSIQPSNFGGNAWRSPATGGRDTCVLDCFFPFLDMVFFAYMEALSSNSRFCRASLVKGLYVNCIFHMFF
jgi:hypothetical protein